jgi:glycosyltransferase involved in cell wall biosynthesis
MKKLEEIDRREQPMGRPLVSVIIATYNMGQYLADAIRSVLEQSRPNLELLVIDDGSTDNTREVVNSFKEDTRLRYHWQPNSGQTRAKNVGVSLARGSFIAFCDADDLWTADKLERQLPAFDDKGRVAVVYSRNRKVDENGMPLANSHNLTPLPSGQVTRQLFIENFVSFGTAIIRRSCLEEVGGFEEAHRMGIDWDLWLRLSIKYEFRYVDAVTYLYRIWPGQISRNWRGRYEHAFRIMKRFIAEHPGAVPTATVNEAYAHCYAQRALLRAELDREYFNAVGDIYNSLKYRPLYLPAWRTFVKIGALATASSLMGRR